jgi:hypothetical protein
MGVSGGPKSNVDGLIFHLDPANKRSYPGTGTTIFDLSGNNYTSYFANGALLADDLIRVDGVDDYIATPLFNLTAPITVTAWVKNVVNEGIVFGASGSGVGYGNSEYIFYFLGKTIVVQGNPGGAKTFQFPQLNLNQWSYLVMTRDASNNMSIYLNAVGSTSNSQSYSNTLQMNQIGRYSNFYNQYNVKGSIGEVKIYNRALSSTEILQNYNVSKARYNVVENIITNGLVLNFDASNPSSYVGTGVTINNIAGVGNTGILTNGPTFSQLNGGSISFDGSNDIIVVGNLGTFYSQGTINVWFNSRNLSTPLGVFSTNYDGFNTNVLRIETGETLGSLKLWVGGNGFGGLIFSNISLNAWYFITITWDQSTNNLSGYLNGILNVSSNAWSIWPSAFVNLGIGMGYNRYLNGNISQFNLYNRALSSTEVLQNYNATKNRYIKVLPPISDALVLNLDAGSRASYVGTGTTWYDLSGNNLNGTLVNGPTFAGTGISSSLVFDRTNDHILIADNSLLNTFSAMTLEVIVKYTTTNDQIFAQKVNYVSGGGYTLELFSSGIAAFCYGSGGSSYLNVAVSSYPANNIYHMLFTLSGNTQTLYINGVSVATNSGGSLPSISGTVFKIGDRTGSYATSSYLGGNVYLTKFYNRALTAAEVLQNFNFYRTRYGI